MKNYRNIIYGLILIALGVIFGLNALGFTNIDVFFDGWWTLFIIVPCIVGLLRGNEVWGNLAGISVGSVILLICQDVISLETVWKLIFPAILVIVGVRLVFKDLFTTKAAKRIKELNGRRIAHKGCYATFSSQNVNLAGEVCTGLDLTAAFGKINCDLNYAVINDDLVINSNATFSKIIIAIPQNVNVVVRSTSVFGGVNRKRIYAPVPGAPTIFINATCLFAGVDLQ